MLEILALIYLTRHVGNIVKLKGRRPGWYKLLTVVLWIGGEMTGMLFGGIVAALTDSSGDPEKDAGLLFMYLFALGGAAAGAGLSVIIARSLTAKTYDLPPQPPVFGDGLR